MKSNIHIKTFMPTFFMNHYPYEKNEQANSIGSNSVTLNFNANNAEMTENFLPLMQVEGLKENFLRYYKYNKRILTGEIEQKDLANRKEILKEYNLQVIEIFQPSIELSITSKIQLSFTFLSLYRNLKSRLLTSSINHVIHHNCNLSFYITNKIHHLQHQIRHSFEVVNNIENQTI